MPASKMSAFLLLLIIASFMRQGFKVSFFIIFSVHLHKARRDGNHFLQNIIKIYSVC